MIGRRALSNVSNLLPFATFPRRRRAGRGHWLFLQPPVAWGDTKKCPICAETIKSIAVRCRYCGTDFDTVDPLSAAEVKDRMKRGESDKAPGATINVSARG